MIAASDPKEYVPFGRQQMGELVGGGAVAPPLQGLVHRLSQVNIRDSSTQDETWTVRGCDEGGDVEEELYVRGRTAVVSRSVAGHPATLLQASYTMESPVCHALFTDFIHTSRLNSTAERVPSLCLIDSTRITVHTRSGEDYIAPLQFQVGSAWSTKLGLLLERVSLCPEQEDEVSGRDAGETPPFTPTTIFSLIHPLNEISPLLSLKQGGELSYMTDPCLRIVLTCEEPSICVLLDLRSGVHSLWKLRQASAKEVQSMVDMMNYNDTTFYSMSGSTAAWSNSTLSPSLLHLSHSHSTTHSTTHHTTHHTAHRPSRSMLLGGGGHSCSVSSSPSFSHSPSHSLHNSTAIRWSGGVHSPGGWQQPQQQSRGGGSLLSGLNSSCDTRLAASQTVYSPAPPRPIVPEICLEHVWTDSPSTRGSGGVKTPVSGGGGGVAFVTRDLVGQQFLCLSCYTARDTLVLHKLTKTNNQTDPDLIVGQPAYISARHALSVQGVKMMAVLEVSGSITLYSGPVPVGKISLAGVTAELVSSTYLKASSLGTSILKQNYRRMSVVEDQLSPVQSREREVSPESQLFRRRLVASSTPGPPSPVSPLPPSQHHILSLRDPVHSSFTLEFHNGSLFRISLPEMSSSPLVGECIRVVRGVLMKDDGVVLLSRWYSVRNAPGTQDIPPHTEWHHFSTTLLELLGYSVERLQLMQESGNTDCDTPGTTKKRRASDLGTVQDWEYLKECGRRMSPGLSSMLRVPVERGGGADDGDAEESSAPPPSIDTAAPLFHYIYNILFSFHLLYEELKLRTVYEEWLSLLGRLLHQIAWDLRLHHYVYHYWIDFPSLCPLQLQGQSQISDEALSGLAVPGSLTVQPPSVFESLLSLVENTPSPPYPCMHGVNTFTKNILQVVCTIKEREWGRATVEVSGAGSTRQPGLQSSATPSSPYQASLNPNQRAVHLLHSLGMKSSDVDGLCLGARVILSECVESVCEDPLPGWDQQIYRLIGRLDMVPQHLHPTNSDRHLEKVMRLRFNKDQRVKEVKRLVESHEPVSINITQRPDVTDHEFIEEQERHLYTLCNRTMALPLARGMMELHTETPLTSEPLSIPRICLHGRAPPCGTRVDLSHIEVVPNMTLWPMFHNGVAAGLRISPSADNVTSAWILFNKPKEQNSELLPEYAGFLMGLGLTGHLSKFNEYRLYEYLTKCHEMTSIGLLLGIAATKRGTMDSKLKKLLSVHIESLLPPTSIEMDILQNVQVAALLGIGLLYQGTGHRHIAQVLLAEIGRPPGPEMENSTDRECYSLAAGLGLGLVVLRKGADLAGLQDLHIADTLHHYMVGGPNRPLTGTQKEKYKSPSYQIREEDRVNNNVTAPGAILALGLMYFNTANSAVGRWLEAPQSEYLLGQVCPDLLLLRVVAHGLVMWHQVKPTLEWVESHVPPSIKPYCFTKPLPNTDHIDYETINQAFVNVIAGGCFVMGLKFAGSANEEAYESLMQVCNVLLSLAAKSIAELIGKATIETCLNVVLLSLAMVMSGTGDLEVVRLCRYLRSRVGGGSSVVTYGSHLATHMALGLLFLGGGLYTLTTTPESVAALIAAFFPRFPTHSNDNRYHLQALRHLYVLAAEPRLMLPKDIDSGELCFANLTVVHLDAPHRSVKLFAPCLLPELAFLKQVTIDDDRYWPVVFQRDKNWHQLEEMLRSGDCVGVKLRAGCLPHSEDPYGYRTLLAQSLSHHQAQAWHKHVEWILAFTCDKTVRSLVSGVTAVEPGTLLTCRLLQYLTRLVYEAVTMDKLSLLPLCIHIVEVLGKAEKAGWSQMVWQLRLAVSHGCGRGTRPSCHIPSDLYLFLSHSLSYLMSQWQNELSDKIERVARDGSVVDGSEAELNRLTSFLCYHGIPSHHVLAPLSSPGTKNPLERMKEMKKLNLSTEAIGKLLKILK